ncbi:MAG: LPD29 domain-containing protein [Gemmatimonadaceae bacterium]|jgi:hypothetical protein
MSIINPDNAKRLVAANPHPIPVDNWDGSMHALAAKNIKAELARAFPGIKFRVTSKAYSMGNHVHTAWTDGPTQAEVDAIVGKYEHSSFDGSDDSTHAVNNDWHVFGSTKYAQTSRHIEDARYLEMATELHYLGCRYERGAIVGPGIDSHISEEIMRKTWATSFCAPAVKTEIKATPSPVVTLYPATTPAPTPPADWRTGTEIEPITVLWVIAVVSGEVECFETTIKSLMQQALGGLNPDSVDAVYLDEQAARAEAAVIAREMATKAVAKAERDLAEAQARLAQVTK